MKKYIPFIACIFFMASCSDSPILVEAGMHHAGGRSTLFTVETVYTVTSKKSGGGISTRSGYTTCYLNAVDVNTGEVLKHKKIGDFKERLHFIGSIGGKAWFYSYDPSVGIHTRDPETLEIGESIKDIIAKNPSLSSGITEQGYQTGVDSSFKFLFTTSKDGYNYLVDPVTLLATKTDERSNRRFYASDDVAENPYNELNDSLEFIFSGSPRSKLQVTTKRFNKENFDFFSHGGNKNPSKDLYYSQVGQKKYDEIDLIEPKMLVDMTAPAGQDRRNPPLADGNVYFVISKSMLGNTYNWVVTAINISYTDAKVKWRYEISNTEKVSYSDKEAISASLVNDKLVLVFENLMIALHKGDGSLVWRKDIRTSAD